LTSGFVCGIIRKKLIYGGYAMYNVYRKVIEEIRILSMSKTRTKKKDDDYSFAKLDDVRKYLLHELPKDRCGKYQHKHDTIDLENKIALILFKI
jgi:hypothetical protein